MNIYFHSAYRELGVVGPDGGLYDRFPALAARDRVGVHTAVDDPEQADAILITEAMHHLDNCLLSRVRRSPTVRRYYSKTFVYSDAPEPAFIMPGLYTNVTRSGYDPANQASINYLGSDDRHGFETDPRYRATRPELLFSISGSMRAHPVRRHLAGLSHPRAEVIDSAARRGDLPRSQQDKQNYHERYRDQLARSKFVLCPRGYGANSYRLYEVLAAGRVPVIISDAWVPTEGPDWDQVAIRIAERDVADIPRVLERAEARYETMAEAARAAYRSFFALDVQFHYIAERLQRLSRTRRAGVRLAHLHAATGSVALRGPQRIREHAKRGLRRLRAGRAGSVVKGAE